MDACFHLYSLMCAMQILLPTFSICKCYESINNRFLLTTVFRVLYSEIYL